MQATERHPAPAGPRRWHLFALIWVLVSYGSLFPFEFRSHDPGWSDLWLLVVWPSSPLAWHDVVGNLLLFAPYGVLLAWPPPPALPLRGFAWGAVFATGLQYLQFWFPDRVPSGVDAVFNVAGMALGYAVARTGSAWLMRRLPVPLERPRFVALATSLMLLWVADRWFPLVPTLDIQNLKNGLKPLLDWRETDALAVLRNTAGWLVFLRLARDSLLQKLSGWQLALLCGLVVLAEPLFLDNPMRPAHLAGLGLAWLLFLPMRKGRGSLVVLTLLLALSIVLSWLAPFEWQETGDFLWMPFAGSLSGNMVHNIAALIEKAFLFGSLLFFLRILGWSHATASCMVAVLLLALEWMQRGLPGRTPEITDPLMVLGLAWLMRPWFLRPPEQVPPSDPSR